MRAISSMATRRVLADLAAAARDAGLGELAIESVGGVDAAKRVAEGEAFDLVFLAQGALRRLAADGHVVADSITGLMLSQTAAAVAARSSTAATYNGDVAFENAQELREMLLDARRIGYSTGPSGSALVSMIEDWGLGDALRPRMSQARPGVPVARSLAEGKIDLGFQQLSELVGQPGVRILGVLPEDCAIETVFAGARTPAAGDEASRMLKFFASAAAAPVLRANSFAPLSS